jgi:para-nitrobenzyl esterase
MTDLRVETAGGTVRGVLRNGVAVWKGIPYAGSPAGALRFLPPRPPLRWEGERDATRFAPVAVQTRDPQAAILSGITDKVPMSEDCLALNVFSPAADGKKRPVLVWIHGGAFIMGSGSTPLYDGTTFAARHDLVVVTLNYRLGLLGLLYLGDLLGEAYAEGNCALLDQIAALRWVRDNIAAFGGDPEAVTVMGESAGAVSVATLLAMPAARGLFARAILQSGASRREPPTRADATALARGALAELGVDPARSDSVAGVPAEQLVAVQERLSRKMGLGAFTPYVDGVAVPRPPIDVVREGGGAPVPVLLGCNRDEWALFDVFLGGGETQAVVVILKEQLGDAALTRLHQIYLEARSDRSDAGAWSDLVGDVAFRMPMIRLAEAQAASGAPVWMYRFDWASPAFDGRMGAAHALELPFVWNTLAQPVAQLLVGGDLAGAQPLATSMHDSWAAFVRTGNPSGGGLPAWPQYEEGRRATMLLDRESRVVDDPGGECRAAWPR